MFNGKQTHTLLLPLQADDVTGYDGYKSVYVLVCISAVFLRGVFVNQALLNLKIITFMTNQHHRRRSASCAKRKYTKPARKRERKNERENDYISIIEQLADRDLINANLVALAAISGIAKQ